MRLIYLLFSINPSPKLSTPQLLETTVWSLVPFSTMASMSFSGIPHSPNPPTSSLSPDSISATAAWADG